MQLTGGILLKILIGGTSLDKNHKANKDWNAPNNGKSHEESLYKNELLFAVLVLEDVKLVNVVLGLEPDHLGIQEPLETNHSDYRATDQLKH